MKSGIIDAHAHCGIQDRYPSQAFEDYHAAVKGSEIEGVVMFAPVAEIYDRYDYAFEDTPEWREQRERANHYLLLLKNREIEVIPYFFIWNDFAVEQLAPEHRGIKWHRHPDEPEYHYDDPRCRKAIDEIRRRRMPVVLEEEFQNTLRFIHEIATGVTVIIPHLGMLNGGYDAIAGAGLWELPHIYADTALASSREIRHYVDHYGHERLLFGSDFPFGGPVRELQKIQHLKFPEETEKAIVGLNLRRLLQMSHPSSIT
jgi:hypothetical protein